MPNVELKGLGKVFDARPDRIDLRDRVFQPKLVSLDERWPDAAFIRKFMPDYVKQGLVLNQGPEGACTGFGLAAVVNFLLWKRGIDRDGKPAKVKSVSPRMLYQLARIYDEWPGEDYEGSSCRGAMKGWHKHGVCARELWEYAVAGEGKEQRVEWRDPAAGYLAEAAKRPLGAYYRINKDSIADLQSAVYEVGAVYVSGNVHGGWSRLSKDEIPVIGERKPPERLGGHSFAIVGYTSDGFIVQNSWTAEWGASGFAVLPYDQWADFGMDAWVAVMGAPMAVAAPSGQAGAPAGSAGRSLELREKDQIGTCRTRSSMNLDDRAGWMSDWSWSGRSAAGADRYTNRAVEPYSQNVAYQLSTVLGNNGRPINQFIDVQSAASAVEEVVRTLPRAWLNARGAKERRVAIYAHGGLNDEEASIKRVRIMAPYFFENGIYPLFVTWKTGVWESITGALTDSFLELFGTPRAEGLGEAIADAKDYTFEKACEHLGIKAIWSEMKQNAAGAEEMESGLWLITRSLAGLVADVPGLSLHFVGHSAGSILLGHLLDLWNHPSPGLDVTGLKASTCTLWAPACTVDFAGETYVPALENGTLGAMSVEAMDDEREKADTVAVYGKSLLYLVSRALEQCHKMPLLGMECAWGQRDGKRLSEPGEVWNADMVGSMGATISRLKKAGATTTFHDKSREYISNGKERIRLAHGSFDNDVEVMTRMLGTILGRKTIPTGVERLAGF